MSYIYRLPEKCNVYPNKAKFDFNYLSVKKSPVYSYRRGEVAIYAKNKHGEGIFTCGEILNEKAFKSSKLDPDKKTKFINRSYFQVNVWYGYQDISYFDWDGFYLEPSFNHIMFGIITCNNSQKTLCLVDEYYAHHLVYSRYGKLAYKLPYFVDDEYELELLKQVVGNKGYDLYEDKTGDNYGYIYNTRFLNHYNYYWNRWWSFCRAFTENNDQERMLEIANSFRLMVKEFTEIIGGTEVYYVDDQGPSQYLYHSDYDWQTIQNEIHTEFKYTMLHIPNWMKTQILWPKEHFPLAFYDNFSDLK